MTKRQLARLVVVAAGGVLALGAAAPAHASGSPSLEPEHANRTAESFAEQDCDDPYFNESPAHHDGWHFFLPESGTGFVRVTLDFQTSTGTRTIAIPDDDGLFPPEQPHHAYLVTPAGWTLLGGVAEVTTAAGPPQGTFRVGYTCPGRPGTGGTPPPTSRATPSPPAADLPPSTSPSQPAAPGAADRRGLPVTGVQVGAMVLLGSGLLSGGIAMLAVRRRKALAELLDEG